MTFAIAAAVWILAMAILGGGLIFFVLPSGEAGGYLAYLVAILAPVPIAVAIWLLLRAAHVPRALVVSLLGTFLGTASVAGLVFLLQTELAPGSFWLPVALLLPATYVLIGKLVFPVDSKG